MPVPLRTTLVVSRRSGPAEASTATDGVSLVVEAGTAGTSAWLANSGRRVVASITVPVRSEPRPEARIGPASRAARDWADGSGAAAEAAASTGGTAVTIERAATVGGRRARE